MIRDAPIKRRPHHWHPGATRLGDVAQMGSGQSAASFSFDPESGLSSDPKLAYYLQDLTPTQLQQAFDGQAPDLIGLLNQETTGTGAGTLPCGQPGNPCGPAPPVNTPTNYLMWACIGLAALFLWSANK
jgi:hypothetical protein